MNKFYKGSLLVIVFVLSINAVGCGKKNKDTSDKKSISIYVDVKDKYSLNIIKFLTDNYEKEKEGIEINIINPLDSEKTEEDILKGSAGDIIFTSRNNMIKLSKKGVLSDLSNIYSKNKINEKYYNIVSSYGRIGDKYYGIGMMPFSIEVFYNTESIQKLGITAPQNITELVSIFKKITESNSKVPVLLTEDLDIYNGLASIIFSNTTDLTKLEEKFDSGPEGYKKLNEMQKLFNDVHFLAKGGNISKETFESVNENAVNRLISGDIPILIGISYITKDLKSQLKDQKIGVIEKYNISPVKENIPIIINSIVCMPTNAKNEEAATGFIEFILSEKAQKALSEEGFVTGYKESNSDKKESSSNEKNNKEDKKEEGKKEENSSMVSIKKSIQSHLQQANSNSIIYVYNLPKPFQSQIESKLIRVLSGKYTSTEWEEIIKEVYGK